MIVVLSFPLPPHRRIPRPSGKLATAASKFAVAAFSFGTVGIRMNHGRHSVGVIMERTPFELDDAPYGPLRGDVYLPPDARGTPVVVACHGFKGFKDWGFWPETARTFCEAGIGFVAFNFSGSGIGEDPEAFTELDRFEANTIGRELEDLGRVLDAVTRRSIPVGGGRVLSPGGRRRA